MQNFIISSNEFVYDMYNNEYRFKKGLKNNFGEK